MSFRLSLLPIALLTAALFFNAGPVRAATESRFESLRAGHVWQKPSWLVQNGSGAFEVDSTWSFETGPELLPNETALAAETVQCEMTPKSVRKVSAGWTAKFFCEIAALTNAPLVKVKYLFSDGEVSGELLGTRLLWALGFSADRMYYFDRVDCFGCTEHPHQDRRIDKDTLVSPRQFEQISIERRHAGSEIKIRNQNGSVSEGFSFEELLDYVPEQGPERVREQTEREALKLLAVFMRHADNKPGNQAMFCSGKTDRLGGCDGQISLLIHDLGLTFGSGFYGDWKASKAIFEHWDQAKIWRDAHECQGEIGLSSEKEMRAPYIREEGRIFLVKLLRAFCEGSSGRKRVEALFKGAHAEQRYGTIDDWTKTFYRKVDELEFPMGRLRSGFQCPRTFAAEDIQGKNTRYRIRISEAAPSQK